MSPIGYLPSAQKIYHLPNWMSRARSRLWLIPRRDQNYLPVLVVDDAAFDWIKPIPKPPTAPASNPSSTSTGTLSRSAFFANFAILYSPVGSQLEIRRLSQRSICNSIPGSQEQAARRCGSER